jgi:hypothetical protein
MKRIAKLSKDSNVEQSTPFSRVLKSHKSSSSLLTPLNFMMTSEHIKAIAVEPTVQSALFAPLRGRREIILGEMKQEVQAQLGLDEAGIERASAFTGN